jgi:hypothetical protein
MALSIPNTRAHIVSATFSKSDFVSISRVIFASKKQCYFVRRASRAKVAGALLILLLPYDVLAQIGELTKQDISTIRRLPFCKVSETSGVPAPLLAGVFLAENKFNRDWKDTVQDLVFSGLLEVRDDKWWQEWASKGLALAEGVRSERQLSNKWPAEVVSTGIVFSIGPAQITPRTALRACDNAANRPRACSGGPKAIVSGLLDENTSVEMASVVLQFEAESYQVLSGREAKNDLGLWATLYNGGAEYFSRPTAAHKQEANGFGIWVAAHADQINTALDCGGSR